MQRRSTLLFLYSQQHVVIQQLEHAHWGRQYYGLTPRSSFFTRLGRDRVEPRSKCSGPVRPRPDTDDPEPPVSNHSLARTMSSRQQFHPPRRSTASWSTRPTCRTPLSERSRGSPFLQKVAAKIDVLDRADAFITTYNATLRKNEYPIEGCLGLCTGGMAR